MARREHDEGGPTRETLPTGESSSLESQKVSESGPRTVGQGATPASIVQPAPESWGSVAPRSPMPIMPVAPVRVVAAAPVIVGTPVIAAKPIVAAAPVIVSAPVAPAAPIVVPPTAIARTPVPPAREETAPKPISLNDKVEPGVRPTLPPSAAMEAPSEHKRTAYGIAGLDQAKLAAMHEQAMRKASASSRPAAVSSSGSHAVPATDPPRFAVQTPVPTAPPTSSAVSSSAGSAVSSSAGSAAFPSAGSAAPPKMPKATRMNLVVEADPKDIARLAKTMAPKAGQSMMLRTAIGAVGERILRTEELELRAYLYGRLGDGPAVMTALLQLNDSFDGQGRNGRTSRAELYRLGRQIAGYLRPPNAPLRARYGVPWDKPPAGKPPAYGGMLSQIRERLSDTDAELLELVFARHLSIAEAASVIDGKVADVEFEVHAARGRLSEIVLPAFRDLDLGDIVADAFRVSSEGAQPIDLQATPDPLPNGVVIGQRYKIEGRIGGGAFAYVYRASDTRVVGHTVALKLLHRPALTPTAREGALRELSLIASAFHPSLVQFKDHGFHEHRLFFVMPWLDGQTLEARLGEGPIAPFDAFVLFEALARAVAALHGAGIRHQDIKPDNILLTKLGAAAQNDASLLPVLIDLGVAAHESDARTAGTPLYFAPEVARRVVAPEDARAVTEKADVYALALTLLHALDPSTRGTIPTELEAFLVERAAGKQVAIPHGLRKLAPQFARWLAVDPAARPTAGEWADELATLSRDPKRLPRKKQGARAPTPLVAGMVLAVTLLTGFALWALTADSRAASSAEAAQLSAERALRETTLLGQRLHDAEERARRLQEELETTRQTCE